MTSPSVSILVPTYNREKHIDACLKSAIDQTCADLEVIVSDNASTDATWDIVTTWTHRDPRVRAFRNPENVGPVRNWERCLTEARGMFAKFLWSDDLIAPTFLAKTLPWLVDDSQVGFVCTGIEIFDESAKARESAYFVGHTGLYDSRLYREGVLADRRFPPSPGCALFRLSDLRKNLTLQIPNRHGIDMAMRGVGADLLLYLKTASDYPRFAFVNETLSFFRAHPDSITTASRQGTVPLLNALAKTHFLESTGVDDAELRRHDAYLFLLLILFRANSFGFKAPPDFYQGAHVNHPDWFYMFRIGLKYLMVRAAKAFERRASGKP